MCKYFEVSFEEFPLLVDVSLFRTFMGHIKGNLIYSSPFFSYDHLASVVRKVLEEKPANISGKL